MKRSRNTMSPSSAEGGNKLYLLLQVIDCDGIKLPCFSKFYSPPKRVKVDEICEHTASSTFSVEKKEHHHALVLPTSTTLQAQPLQNVVSTPPGSTFDESRADWDRQLQQHSNRTGFGSCDDSNSSLGMLSATTPSMGCYRNYLLTAIPAGQSLEFDKQRQPQPAGSGMCVSTNQASNKASSSEITKGSPSSPFVSDAAATHMTRTTPSPPTLMDLHNFNARNSPGSNTEGGVRISSSPGNYTQNYRLDDYALKFKAVFQSKANAVHKTPGAQIKKFQFIKEAYKEVVGREKDIRGGRKTKFDQMVERCFHEVTSIPKRTLKRKKQAKQRNATPILSDTTAFQPVKPASVNLVSKTVF
jgi:hypothetical protein